MTITLYSKLTPVDYIPISEREADTPTTFKLKPLNGAEYLDVMCHMVNDENGGQRLSRTGLEKIMRYGVKGVNNLIDENGKPINKVKPDMFGPILLSEIASEIMSISEVDEQEKKISTLQ